MWRIWTHIWQVPKEPVTSGALTRRVSVSGLVIFVLLTAACASSAVQQTVQTDTFRVGPSAKLTVESVGGRVDVIAGPPGVIVIQASIQNPDKLLYEVKRDGDSIFVTAKRQPGLRNLAQVNGPSVEIIITAPSTTFIDVETHNGDVEIEGMQASGRVVTSSGAITLEGVIGDFVGGTADGEINIDSMIGKAFLETTNGDVNVVRGKGAFELATGNGTIYFQGELTPGGNNGFLTSNGNIVIKLDGEPSLRVLASTVNGRVVSSWTLAAGSMDDNSVSGVIGAGEADLVINAANGSVTLE